MSEMYRGPDYDGEVASIYNFFEYEYCHECGKDLDAHTIGPDALGHAHAWCNMAVQA